MGIAAKNTNHLCKYLPLVKFHILKKKKQEDIVVIDLKQRSSHKPDSVKLRVFSFDPFSPLKNFGLDHVIEDEH